MSDQPKKSAIRYFGDYILLGEIARGGMGVVYHAVQASLDREVAIKMIDAGNLAGEAASRRFQTEAEAMAQLDHPNIVSIYEVGEHEGQCYLAMKLIEGNSLAEEIAEGRWNIDANNRKERQQAIARLMATVAGAVHHAHQRGVLHRDIKPGNILLDEEGEPHVTDFGLAKLTENDAGLSQTGAVLGTPSYMAPEQAAGKTRQITTATDVYALGVVLYELLTGERPFHADDVIEILKMVVQQEPRRPRSLNPLLDRDLETICLKCLEKSPKNRYHTAEELTNDLERWLDGKPIQARPSSTAERFIKWAKRRPAIAGLSAAVLLLFLAVVIGSPIAIARVSTARDQANRNALGQANERQRAQTVLERMQMRRAEELLASGDSGSALAHLSYVLRQNPSNHIASQRLLSALTYRNFTLPISEQDQKGVFDLVRFDATGTRLITVSESIASNWVVRISDCSSKSKTRDLLEYPAQKWRPQISESGRNVIVQIGERNLAILDSMLARPVGENVQFAFSIARTFFLSAQDSLIVQLTDYSVWVLDLQTGRLNSNPLRLSAPLENLIVSPDGRRAITSQGTPPHGIPEFSRSEIRSGCILQSWEIETGEPSFKPIEFGNGHLEVHHTANGRRLITVFDSGTSVQGNSYRGTNTVVQIWDSSGQAISPLIHHLPNENPKRWQPKISLNGERIAVGIDSKTVAIWKIDSGKASSELLRSEKMIDDVEFMGNGDRIASIAPVGRLREIHIWRSNPIEPLPLAFLSSPSGFRFSSDGELLSLTTLNGEIQTFNCRSGELLWRCAPAPGMKNDVRQFSSDERSLLVQSSARDTSTYSSQFRLLDSETGSGSEPVLEEDLFKMQNRSVVTRVSKRPWSYRHRLRDFTPSAAIPDVLLDRSSNMPFSGKVVFNKDASQMLTIQGEMNSVVGLSSNAVGLLETSRGQLARESIKVDGRILAADFDAFGRPFLVKSSLEGRITMVDAVNGHPLSEAINLGLSSTSVAFGNTNLEVIVVDRRQKHLITITSTRLQGPYGSRTNQLTANLWSFSSNKTVLAVQSGGDRSPGSPVSRFSPDGLRAFVALPSTSGSIAQLIDVKASRLLGAPLKFSASKLTFGGRFPDLKAEFSPSSQVLALAVQDNSIQIINSQSGETRPSALSCEGLITSLRFSPDSKLLVVGNADGKVRVLNADSGQLLGEIAKCDSAISCAEFSPDGDRFVTVTKNGMIRIWDTKSTQPVSEWLQQSLSSSRSGDSLQVRFSPDGNRVLVTDQIRVSVWDAPNFPRTVIPEVLELTDAIAGHRITDQGSPDPISFSSYLEIKRRLLSSVSSDPQLHWMKWLVSDHSTRSISPFSQTLVPDYVRKRVTQNTRLSLKEAVRIDPSNALGWARLAELEFRQLQEERARAKVAEVWPPDAKYEWDDPELDERVKHRARRALSLSPNDPEVVNIVRPILNYPAK